MKAQQRSLHSSSLQLLTIKKMTIKRVRSQRQPTFSHAWKEWILLASQARSQVRALKLIRYTMLQAARDLFVRYSRASNKTQVGSSLIRRVFRLKYASIDLSSASISKTESRARSRLECSALRIWARLSTITQSASVRKWASGMQTPTSSTTSNSSLR